MFLRADWLADDNPPLFLLSQEAPIILDLIQLYQHIRHKRFSLRVISTQMGGRMDVFYPIFFFEVKNF
jgi:hypothetical protein